MKGFAGCHAHPFYSTQVISQLFLILSPMPWAVQLLPAQWLMMLSLLSHTCPTFSSAVPSFYPSPFYHVGSQVAWSLFRLICIPSQA